MDHRSAIISSAFLLLSLGAFEVRAQAPATLTIEVNRAKASVSPTLYGLMTEEINYSYDGGCTPNWFAIGPSAPTGAGS